MCFDSTYFDLKTLRQVSLYRQASDLEMNWTSSFLVQGDKLVIVLHLLLAPVCTVVQPAEHEFVRHRSPLPVASRCFALSLGLTIEMTGCRTRFSHDPHFQCSSHSPGHQRSGWAHNLWEEVVQENCHALEEVVDLRSGVKM